MLTRRQFIKRTVLAAMGIASISSPIGPAFAKSLKAKCDNSEVLIREEIDKRMEVVMETVYEQLLGQDKLAHFPVYEEVIRSMITESVKREYRFEELNSIADVNDSNYVFPYGGVIGYTSSLGATVSCTHMDYDNTYHYVLLQNASIASTIIQACLGFIPNWGYAFSALFGLSTVVNQIGKNSIANANGYGYILSVSYILESTSTVLLGWGEHPVASVPSGAYDIHAEAFSYHNPWS